MISSILFILLFILSIYIFSKKLNKIYKNIKLGKPFDQSGNKVSRWKNVLLLAFGQKKMFRNPLVAFLHLIIYLGFIIINIEVLEICIDGIFNTHRYFSAFLPTHLYVFIINFFELFSLGVIISCIIFIIRRVFMKIKRLNNKDLEGFPKKDALYILFFEIILMLLFLGMNSTDQLINKDFNFLVSPLLQPLFIHFNRETIDFFQKIFWWLHIMGIFIFMNYLPYSKHLHILLAFPNAYWSKINSVNTLVNVPSIQQEVIYTINPNLAPTEPQNKNEKFGAVDVFDLSQKSLLDAYSCTECGRCSNSCPANQTGKLLSPRKIMMATRDRLEIVGNNISKNGKFSNDQKTLLNDYISAEELWACTTCNACVTECPVSISPLDIIIELRRGLILEQSSAPKEWNSMFYNMENNNSPWKFSVEDRLNWLNKN